MKAITLQRHKAKFLWEGIRVHVTELFDDNGNTMSPWNVDFYRVDGAANWIGSLAYYPDLGTVEPRSIKDLTPGALEHLTATIIAAPFTKTAEAFMVEEPGDRCQCCGQLRMHP